MSAIAEKWRAHASKNEFVSSLETIQPAEELFFPVAGFGEFDKYLKHACDHPAKINLQLVVFLIKRYTKQGDKIFDPLAGTGSAGVVAAAIGRNAVQIELVPQFHRWMEEAKKNVESDSTIKDKGSIRNFCGDARKASKYVGQEEINAILTSPPYGNQNHFSNPRS